MFWSGLPFFERGWQSIVTRHLNMFTLVAIGTGVAWSYSAVATLFPGLFPPAFHGMDGAVGVYFEAAAVITVLVLLGQVLELKARDSTSTAIRGLLDLAPKTARRIAADGAEHDVPLDTVVLGDRLRVRPGETVPVDGAVETGEATVDQASVTGESLPVAKRQGDVVIGGTVIKTGTLVIRAEKVGRDTLLSRIVRLVADAQRSRAPIQRTADRVSGWFVPAVLAAALAAFAVWMAGRAGAAPGLCDHRGRVGPDHRLPLRARSRDPHVDHGRGRPRRPRRRADPQRRGAGAAREGRYGRARQDRHADRRQAGPDGRCGRAWFCRRRGHRSRGRRRARQRTPARPSHRRGRHGARPRDRRGLGIRRPGRAWSLGPGRQAGGPGRFAAVPRGARRRLADPLGCMRTTSAGKAPRPCWSRSMEKWRVSSVSPTVSDRTAPPWSRP